MKYINLDEAKSKIEECRKRREEIHYTGREDLDLIERIRRLKAEVRSELNTIRAVIGDLDYGSAVRTEYLRREAEIEKWLNDMT